MKIPSELTLWINEHLAERIGLHGSETYPYECCGALLGRDSESEGAQAVREVLALFPMVNRRDDSPRNRFSVTAKDVREAEKVAEAQKLEVIGWYHSHPDHPARPSEYDREHAWPWYSYIIVNVQKGSPETMTSWRLNEDRQAFVPEGIEIRDRAAV